MCFQRSSERIEGKSRLPQSGWKIVPQSRTGCRETPVAKFVVCSWHEQLPDVVGMRPQRTTTSVRQKMTVIWQRWHNTTQYLHYTTIQLPAAITTTKTTPANFFNQWTHCADELRKSGFILQQFCYTDLHFARQPNMLQASNTILWSGFARTGAIIRHSKRVKISRSRNASCDTHTTYQNSQWSPAAKWVFSMQTSDEPQLECSSRELSAAYCRGLETSVSVTNIFYQTLK